jgi:hypothetical protein
MIYDPLTNLARYTCIPHAREIAGFLAAHDTAGLADGAYLWCRISGTDTRAVPVIRERCFTLVKRT